MHQQAARPWTVATLGAQVGMSRASFAARFKELVGLPPLVYLQRWRILAASRELRCSKRTVASMAAVVKRTASEGGNAAAGAAFSTAFTRITSISPAHYHKRPARSRDTRSVNWPATPVRVTATVDERAGSPDA
ncbi:hypothetical protein [Streptomyces sp. NPDC058086]|uniref:hypothetical protein n=1 Tax=Streptomyces sp. NPDC058086 TaxID=3346334 RepID=UPI0036E3A37C